MSAVFGHILLITVISSKVAFIGSFMMMFVPIFTICGCVFVYRRRKSYYALKIAVPEVRERCLKDKSYSDMVLSRLSNEPLFDYVAKLRKIKRMREEEQIGSL